MSGVIKQREPVPLHSHERLVEETMFASLRKDSERHHACLEDCGLYPLTVLVICLILSTQLNAYLFTVQGGDAAEPVVGGRAKHFVHYDIEAYLFDAF